jgi:hypothetical protein
MHQETSSEMSQESCTVDPFQVVKYMSKLYPCTTDIFVFIARY